MNHDASYYAKRILELGIEHPDVDSTEHEQIIAYTERMCDKLCLRSEPIVEELMNILPSETSTNIVTADMGERPRGFQ